MISYMRLFQFFLCLVSTQKSNTYFFLSEKYPINQLKNTPYYLLHPLNLLSLLEYFLHNVKNMNTKIQIFGKYSKTTQIKNLSTCIFLKHRVYVLFWVHVCGFFLMFMLQNPSADALLNLLYFFLKVTEKTGLVANKIF